MTEPELIGYLLDLLEDSERAAVEAWLAQSADGQMQLQQLRAWLEKLALNDNDPPGELTYRTLRRIVAFEVSRRHQQQPTVPAVPVSTPSQPATSSRGRRADVFVLVAVLTLLAALVPPAMLQARHRQQIVACQNNLRLMHTMLQCYADDRGGHLPRVPERGPLAFAGVFVVMLREAQTWDERSQVVCPASRPQTASRAMPKMHPELPDLHGINSNLLQCWAQSDDENYRQRYRQVCQQLGGCYAYHLGYRDASGQLHGLRIEEDGYLPILGDRPPRPEEEPIHWRTKNSPNHGGFGQNVLFLSGHVRFQRCRHCTGLDEDIYLNRRKELAAGCDRSDAVLAPSEISPCGILLADIR